jgi:hypothetical protein
MTARNARLRAALLVIALDLGACALGLSEIVFSPAPRPQQGMGLVYVFRPDAAAALMSAPVVRIDGKTVIALRAAEYTAIHLPAGRHTASLEPEGFPANSPARDLEFVVESGQVGALALGFMRGPLERGGTTIPSKQGKMTIPPGASPTTTEGPFAWEYVPAIEASPLYPELLQRRYRPATSPEYAPR